MRLVEEEHQHRLFRITHLRHHFKQLRQQPQQKRCVQLRRLHQLVRRENIDHPATAVPGLQQVLQIERRLAEELVSSLLLNRQQPALDRPNARRRNVPVMCPNLIGVVRHELQHRPKIFQVQQQQPVVIRRLEDNAQHSRLRVVQVQQPAQQQRSHLGYRRPHRMPLLSQQVPEHHRIRPVLVRR